MFYTFEQLQYLYDIPRNAVLKYFHIVTNIKSEWKKKKKKKKKNILKEENPTYLNQTDKKALHILNQQKGSINKYLYHLQFKTDNIQKLKAEVKWEAEFPEQEFKWSQHYQMSFSCTIDVKLRIFQYKYLMRYIPNNKYLFKSNIAPSVLCDFCLMQEESNSHPYWECWHVQEFWSKIQNFLLINNLEIQLNYFRISFGIAPNGNLKHSVFNFVILLAKYYIFGSKYKHQIPNIKRFLSLLERTREF